MAVLEWDKTGERVYETGVSRGVLYVTDRTTGAYDDAEAWNGLTGVTSSPSGAESNKQYADNRVYLNLISAEEYGATIEAFTFPDKFMECDGTFEPVPGVAVGQQGRRTFGFSWQTLIGNDLVGTDHGYKIHMVWGALASPSEKAYATVNDSPEAATFSWEVTTTPVEVGTVDDHKFKPTAYIAIDSTKVEAADLKALEDLLYGTAAVEPRLPLPREVIEMFDAAVVTP